MHIYNSTIICVERMCVTSLVSCFATTLLRYSVITLLLRCFATVLVHSLSLFTSLSRYFFVLLLRYFCCFDVLLGAHGWPTM